jgi:hypothetical protein
VPAADLERAQVAVPELAHVGMVIPADGGARVRLVDGAHYDDAGH